MVVSVIVLVLFPRYHIQHDHHYGFAEVMVIVDGVHVTTFKGDGCLVATKVLYIIIIIIIISAAAAAAAIVNIFNRIVAGGQRWILLGSRLPSLKSI